MAHKPPQRKDRPHRAIAASIAFRAATPQRRTDDAVRRAPASRSPPAFYHDDPQDNFSGCHSHERERVKTIMFDSFSQITTSSTSITYLEEKIYRKGCDKHKV
uniref:Uncharacterized protein n=1 Tax=Oryza glaberrima TaxID=4538 RepID=I1QXN8_ORYGL